MSDDTANCPLLDLSPKGPRQGADTAGKRHTGRRYQRQEGVEVQVRQLGRIGRQHWMPGKTTASADLSLSRIIGDKLSGRMIGKTRHM